MKLRIGIDLRRIDKDITFSNEVLVKLFDNLCHNPIFTEWDKMQINKYNEDYDEFNYEKIIKAINSPKKDLGIFCLDDDGNEFIFSRNKINYSFSLKFSKENLDNKVDLFRDFMVDVALSMPQFGTLTGSAGMEIYDYQKEQHLPEEKSFLSYMAWLNVLSPLGYDTYYEKEDLLKAPFYDVREIAPDIVFIQSTKDPFDIKDEESLNYLRNGVNYLNQNIIYLKGK